MDVRAGSKRLDANLKSAGDKSAPKGGANKIYSTPKVTHPHVCDDILAC